MDSSLPKHKSAFKTTGWIFLCCFLAATQSRSAEPHHNEAQGNSQKTVDSSSNPDSPDSELPRSRSFHLGFTPSDLLDTPEVSQGVFEALSGHADLVAFHIGNGVPWEESLNEQDFSAPVDRELSKLSRLKSRLRGERSVYLAVTPLNLGRNDIAKSWGDDGTFAKKWKGRKFDDPETILAYTHFCRRMIRIFQPDYFVYGVEANMLAIWSESQRNETMLLLMVRFNFH